MKKAVWISCAVAAAAAALNLGPRVTADGDTARHVAADWQARGIAHVEVRADSFAALNGRPVQRLIDPGVDLAAPSPPGWIVPLERNPLPLDAAGSR
jgi:hypothetical protein